MVSLLQKHVNVMLVVFQGHLIAKEPIISVRFSIPMGANLGFMATRPLRNLNHVLFSTNIFSLKTVPSNMGQ